ncbi:MAG: sulfite exporter TauE/SafE family protein, partial [Candidatus Micrarchaeota archaeon]
VEKAGYKIDEDSELTKAKGFDVGTVSLLLGGIAIIAGVYLILTSYLHLDLNFTISEETSVIALLVLGFLTGFHCIGMCGGFVLSYAGKIKQTHEIGPHLMYGAGKTISYTVIGALFGIVGSVIAFTTELRGSIAIIAGLFLVLYGLNMLNIFPILRKFQLKLPTIVSAKTTAGKGPLVTGLLNGLMLACGPLQALYIFAAGTGNALTGGKALFFFGLGTLIPLLGFGILSRYLSSVLTNNIIKFSGVLVILLGLLMASNGLNLMGIGLPVSVTSNSSSIKTDINLDSEGYQVIKMNVTNYGWEPNSFVLKKDVPVKWEINAKELNGCNNEIIAREYGLDIKLKLGVQTVTFTPKNTGTVRWSCWMGMIPGQFVVVDDINAVSASSIPPVPQGGSCGGSGGGCGCGG